MRSKKEFIISPSEAGSGACLVPITALDVTLSSAHQPTNGLITGKIGNENENTIQMSQFRPNSWSERVRP